MQCWKELSWTTMRTYRTRLQLVMTLRIFDLWCILLYALIIVYGWSGLIESASTAERWDNSRNPFEHEQHFHQVLQRLLENNIFVKDREAWVPRIQGVVPQMHHRPRPDKHGSDQGVHCWRVAFTHQLLAATAFPGICTFLPTIPTHPGITRTL